MFKYSGDKCIVCEQKFSENDDIVVCPECGTPYHRECYLKNGKCINTELHKSGKSWKAEKKPVENKNEPKKCSFCGFVNKPSNIMCEGCGAPLDERFQKSLRQYTENSSNTNSHINPNINTNGSYSQSEMYNHKAYFNNNDKYCGMNPDEKFESVKLKELSDFVNRNQLYYLPIFKKIRDTGKKVFPNFASFLFPELYFANRKMWLWTAISIVLSTLFSLPTVIYMLTENGFTSIIDIESKAFAFIYSISNYINFIFKVLMLLFANWFYYRHAINKISRRKLSRKPMSTNELSSAGGTSLAGIFISFTIEITISMLIMLIISRYSQ